LLIGLQRPSEVSDKKQPSTLSTLSLLTDQVRGPKRLTKTPARHQ